MRVQKFIFICYLLLVIISCSKGLIIDEASYEIDTKQIDRSLSSISESVQKHFNEIGINLPNTMMYYSIIANNFKINESDFEIVKNLCIQHGNRSFNIDPVVASENDSLWINFGQKLPSEFAFPNTLEIANGRGFVLFISLSLKADRQDSNGVRKTIIRCDSENSNGYLLARQKDALLRIEKYSISPVHIAVEPLAPPMVEKAPSADFPVLQRIRLGDLEKYQNEIWKIDWEQEKAIEKIKAEMKDTGAKVLKIYNPSDSTIYNFFLDHEPYGHSIEEFKDEELMIYIFKR